MTVEVRKNTDDTNYEAGVDGKLAGYIDYLLRPGTITMIHTEVDPEYKGQGVGSVLAKEALNDTRKRGLKVRPLCPFIASYIRRHPDEYLDLVDPEMREKVLAAA